MGARYRPRLNPVTLIGDPWQALYLFRGAKPDVVPDLLARNSVPTLPFGQSFRWQSEEAAATVLLTHVTPERPRP